MRKLLALSLLALLCVSGFTQSVTLTFTGRDANNNHCQLDRVAITNLTKSWQETIYWPDTTLTMQAGTGIEDYAGGDVFALSQNNPNPFNGTTEANLTVVEPGDVLIEVADVNGRIVETQNFASLQTGNYRFRIQISTAGIYFMTARQRGQSSTIKMVNNGGGSENSVEYVGIENTKQPLTSAKGGTKGATNNPFSFGDQMEYVGYATFNGTEAESQRIQQMQGASQTFTLQFDVAPQSVDGQPCPEASTITDVDGNVYNTVQIGRQCWMRENLRTTKYADGTSISLDSSMSTTKAYRYCPNSDANNVSTYGYLYNWTAVMHNSSSSTANPSGVQGICPTGWHVPSDAEWTQLTSYVSSQSEYVCGSDNDNIAKALASATGWNSSTETCAVGDNPSTNNATGFSAVPAGGYYGSSSSFGYGTYFWSAAQSDASLAYYRFLTYSYANVDSYSADKVIGFSVRCLRD